MTRKPRRRDATEAELSVLKELWSAGPLTIRELTDRIYPDSGAAQYATVQKLLERLGAKQCVDRQAQGRGHVYSATVMRDELIARRLKSTAEQLCEGSLTPLLTQLVKAGSLTRKDLTDLWDLVERADRDSEAT